MDDAFTRKLRAFAPLAADELRVVAALIDQVVDRKAGDDLIHEGERPDHVHLLLDGWAYRYKLLPDGGRQIMAYLIPGDLCNVNIFILKKMDHSLGLLSDARIALIPERAMIDLLDTQPRIARALFWATLVDEATLRESLVNTLRRDPFESVSHLFCELWVRMRTVGLVADGTFDLPLTQGELGDTIGLNSVTVNRVLQRLRTEELITLKRGRLTILDADRLMTISSFNPNYLHLDGARPAARQGS